MKDEKYCELCESTKCDKEHHKRFEQSLKDAKEGRTYIFSCSHSKKGLFVCHDCHVKDCNHWYNLGRADLLKEIEDKSFLFKKGDSIEVKKDNLVRIIQELSLAANQRESQTAVWSHQ